MTGLTVFSIIRNGVLNGYPFVEAYASWLGYCDRIVILDGESTDGTQLILAELAGFDESFEIASRPWPSTDGAGQAIAEQTEAALALATPGSDRLMYVQADEVYTPDQRRLIRDWHGGAIEFRGCVNFWNSFDSVLANDFPMRYVRLIRAESGARSMGDGFSFDVDPRELTSLDEWILHYGWCFPVNVLQKHVNHSEIYRDRLQYRLRGALARRMLASEIIDRRSLNALLPEYEPVPFKGEHPECVKHLLGDRTYDPHKGLELLRSGVRW